MALAPILAATDLSPASDEAIRQADALARASGAPLAVCHVVEDLLPLRLLFPQERLPDLLDQKRLLDRAEDALLARALEVTGRREEELELHVRVDEPYAGVVRIAEELGAARLVVASRGRTGLSTVLLGSVAERVARLAHGPVLVARPSPAGPVIAASDLSDASESALRLGAEEARRRGAKLHAVHVTVGPALVASELAPLVPEAGAAVSVERVRAESVAARAALEATVARLGIAAEVDVVQGRPVRELPALASALGASLVVVGTHGRTGLGRVLLGSVAEAVVRHAPCSVLVARRP